MTLSAEQAYTKLAERCASSEICTREAYDKLLKWGLSPTDAGNIVQRLTDERFIDDSRFAGIWVRDKLYNARWGMLKIRNSLHQKRIDSSIIETALTENFDQDRYFSNLASALRSKAKTLPTPLPYEAKIKLARFAISRGYEPNLVQEMINEENYWREQQD